MSDIDWPVTLPAARVEFSSNVLPSLIRTQMETGRVRQRRRFTSKQQTWQLDFIFTTAQLAIFETFFETDLASGANNFFMYIADSAGLTRQMVRMVSGEYSTKQVPPDNWKVSMVIEKGFN